jgi:metal-responsive CopG/Arc/MetJ family transcriptional regulator
MRVTRTWTISLPPAMSELAQEFAKREHRTKSELVREALRRYLAQRSRPVDLGAGERLARVGELAELYRQRHAARRPSETELRQAFRGVRALHDRLKRHPV